MGIRIGHGYDAHRFAPNRKLFIGCVNIPYDRGLLGHSDADVLCHAIADALLGACGLRDIGYYFPDNDAAFENMSGTEILSRTSSLLSDKNASIINIDSTVIAQSPKLSSYITEMKHNISLALSIPIENINIKATTEEGMGFTGKGEGISAHAVCLISM